MRPSGRRNKAYDEAPQHHAFDPRGVPRQILNDAPATDVEPKQHRQQQGRIEHHRAPELGDEAVTFRQLPISQPDLFGVGSGLEDPVLLFIPGGHAFAGKWPRFLGDRGICRCARLAGAAPTRIMANTVLSETRRIASSTNPRRAYMWSTSPFQTRSACATPSANRMPMRRRYTESEARTALGRARQLDRETEPEQEREDRVELSREERVDDPLCGLVPPCGERIETRRPGIARAGGARQIDGENAKKREATQHIEDDDPFLGLDRRQRIRRGDRG